MSDSVPGLNVETDNRSPSHILEEDITDMIDAELSKTLGYLESDDAGRDTVVQKTGDEHAESAAADMDVSKRLKNKVDSTIYLQDVLSLPSKALMKISKLYIKPCNHRSPLTIINNIRTSNPAKMNLIEFLKLLDEKCKFEKPVANPDAPSLLKDNSLKRAKLDMSYPEVWMITASGIDWKKGKKYVLDIFQKYGKVLDICCIGKVHPLETVQVFLDSYEACQKAMDDLNARSDSAAEGVPKNVTLMENEKYNVLTGEEKERANNDTSYQERWFRLNEMMNTLFYFYSVKRLFVYDEIIEEAIKNGSENFDKKAVVRKVISELNAFVKDGQQENEAWKDDKELSQLVKKSWQIGKVIEQVKSKFANNTLQYSNILQQLKKMLEERYNQGVDISEKAVVKIVFYSFPEIEVKRKHFLEYEIPDQVSLSWLLLQNLPTDITEDELSAYLKKSDIRVEKMIILNKSSSNICAVVKVAGNKKNVRKLCSYLRHEQTIAGHEAHPVKFMRYTGKLANNSHPFNVRRANDDANTEEKAESTTKRKSAQDCQQPAAKKARGSPASKQSSGAAANATKPTKLNSAAAVILNGVLKGVNKQQITEQMETCGQVQSIERSNTKKSTLIYMATPAQAHKVVAKFNNKHFLGSDAPVKVAYHKSANAEFPLQKYNPSPKDQSKGLNKNKNFPGKPPFSAGLHNKNFGPSKQPRNQMFQRPEFNRGHRFDNRGDMWSRQGVQNFSQGPRQYGHNTPGNRMSSSPMQTLRDAVRKTNNAPPLQNPGSGANLNKLKDVLIAILDQKKGQGQAPRANRHERVESLQKQVEDLKQQQERLQGLLQDQMTRNQPNFTDTSAAYADMTQFGQYGSKFYNQNSNQYGMDMYGDGKEGYSRGNTTNSRNSEKVNPASDNGYSSFDKGSQRYSDNSGGTSQGGQYGFDQDSYYGYDQSSGFDQSNQSAYNYYNSS